jgi:hypothetical protein
MNPINLALRFILEIVALVSVGVWGWRFTDQWPPYILAIGIPVVLALVWGTFNVPNDPSRSGGAPIAVSGRVRLGIEVGVFAIAAWALYDLGYTNISLIFVIAVIVHYIASHERIVWLLRH